MTCLEPAVTSARDVLWESLGIDPDRITREEFDELMDAHDRSLAERADVAVPEVVSREEVFQVRWRGPRHRSRDKPWTTLMRGFDTADEARPVAQQMIKSSGVADTEIVAARTVCTVEEHYGPGDQH